MRTGAIFARGSCRALKWVALFGVLFALGVGEASAQPSLVVNAPSTVPEGANRVPVTVQLKVPAETGVGAIRAETVTVTLTLTPRPDSGTGLPADRGKNAELGENQDASWAAGETGQVVTATAGTVAITFNNVGNAAYDRTERAYLNIGSDTDAEDEELVITSVSTSTNTDPDTAITPSGEDEKVKIVDAQTQTYTLAPTNFGTENTINEGKNIPLTLTADPAKTVDVSLRVTLDSADDSDYGLDSVNSTSEDITVPGNVLDDGTAPTTPVGIGTVTLFSQENDEDRVDDTVTLMTAYTEGDKRGKPAAEDLEILVRDQHKLPKVSRDEDIEVEDDEGEKSDVTMLYEGQTGTVTLMVNRTGDGVPDSEDITVELSLGMGSTATRQDYRLNPDEVEIEGSGETGTFELEALMDEDVSADGETLVLMATVSGDEDFGPNPDDPVMLDAITINDRTAKKIWPRSKDEAYAAINEARAEGAGDNGLWNPGETMTLMAEDLFDWPETTTNVVLGNAISEDQQIATAATSNDSLAITARSGGMTEISVTATVIAESSSFMPSQTVSNVANVKFSVSVDAHAITGRPQADVDAAVEAAIIEEGGNRFWSLDDGMVMVPLEKLFNVPDGVSPDYLAESSDDDVAMARISGDDMYVNLTHVSAGDATIMVTAVDTDSGATASVRFDIKVYSTVGARVKPQTEVDEVFETAGAGDLVAQGSSISVDMSELFVVAEDEGWSARYSAETSDADVLMTSVSGTILTLTPGSDPAGGMATITVAITAMHEDGRRGVFVHPRAVYEATVGELAQMLTITSDPMDMVEEGGSITVTAMLNQNATGDMIIPVEVTGPATPAETNILLMDGMDEASVMLMANDDHDPMSDWNDIVIVVSHAAVEGGAAVMTLSVTENDSEIDYTLSGPDDMNAVEGMEYTITAEASSAVPMETTVEIMRDRAASTADDDDYTVENITIMAGETMGTTMLMVTEDDMPDGGTDDNMSESLVLFGMVGNMQTNDVKFYLWDAAVPALPVIAQLLLAAFLAIGGYRRYLRR